MSPKNVDGDTIHEHVKIFLSCCHHFVRGHYGGGTEEFWETKGNFVSMMNLCEQI